ncbi:AbrB family transcriptional regulator [Planococcus glaciei]|uniref:AbrB family transcriptional regulator n=2 Tax=Planococcus glaciei TaxID=459472 RepID=A0A7H8QFN2_9BACL|nr:AbrB family transcriptional regulator [Planococcus glaciei]
MGKAFIVGLAGALLFEFIGAPMPWLLGSLFAVLLVQLFTPVSLKWDASFRNTGLVIAGYVIGIAFTLDALNGMKQYFLPMLAINIVFFGLFLMISSLMANRTNVDKATAMTCCVPGGMSQIITFAEEQKTVDLTAVTFYHVFRVLLIVAAVPFIVASGGTAQPGTAAEGEYSIYLFVLLAFCCVAGMVFKKINVPTAFLLGPIFLIMALNIAEVDVPLMPSSLLHIAQLLIGIYIGLLLKKEDIKLTPKLIFYSVFSSAVLIAFAYGLSFILQDMYDLSFSTSFLSVVPGGLDQMGIIAASVHADVTVVTAFQLFRIIFLSVFIVPFVKVVAGREKKVKSTDLAGSSPKN